MGSSSESGQYNVLVIYSAAHGKAHTTHYPLMAFSNQLANHVFYLDCQPNTFPETPLSWFDAIVIHHSVPLLNLEEVSKPLLVQLTQFSGPKIWLAQENVFSSELSRVIDLVRGLNLAHVFTQHQAQAVKEALGPSVNVTPFYFDRFISDEALSKTFEKHYMRRMFDMVYQGDTLELGAMIPCSQKESLLTSLNLASKKRFRVSDLHPYANKDYCGPQWINYLSHARSLLTLLPKEAFFADQQLALPWHLMDAVATGAALVCFEADYGPQFVAHQHYIPLASDLSNLDQVFETLADGAQITKISEAAHQSLIPSAQWTHQRLIASIDQVIKPLLTDNPKHVAFQAIITGAYEPPERVKPLTEPKTIEVGTSLHLRSLGIEPSFVTTMPELAPHSVLSANLSKDKAQQGPPTQSVLLKKVGKELNRFYQRRILLKQP